MSRSYWVSVLAAGLILGQAAYAGSIGHDGSDPKSPAVSQSQPRTNPPPSVPASVQNDIKRIARALETESQERSAPRDTSKPDQYAQKNLSDQDSMATWAKAMFGIGLLELFLTGAGVVLLYMTLNEERRLGIAQIRAYLSCEESEFYFWEQGVTCTPVLKNTGQSLASHITIIGKLRLYPSWKGINNIETISIVPPIPAGLSDAGGLMFRLSARNDPDLIAEPINFIIECKAEWRDVFGRTQIIEFTLTPTETSDLVDVPLFRHRPGKVTPQHRTPQTEEEKKQAMAAMAEAAKS